MENVRMYEYTSAANPRLPPVPIALWNASLCDEDVTEIKPFDNAKDLCTDYACTSPSLLVSFVQIMENDKIQTPAVATSHFFYVISGEGYTLFDTKHIVEWKKGDIFVLPYQEQVLEHFAKTRSVLLWVTDEPLLKYLGVVPQIPKFEFTFFSHEILMKTLQAVRTKNEKLNLNRLGILLGNKDTENTTKTITHTLWSLMNVLPAVTLQKPHRHNSVALDLCIFSNPEKKEVYTLIGEELDEHGNIKDPIKCYWQSGSLFVTPPGLWHSHHNDTDEDAYVLPIQDAGLYTYLRTLNIQFSK